MAVPKLAAWWILGALQSAPGGDAAIPFRVGLCVSVDARGAELAFVQGAELAAAIRNRRGGVFGHPLALVPLGPAEPAGGAAVLAALAELELTAVLAPGKGEGLARVRAEGARRGLAVLTPDLDPAHEAGVLIDALVGTYRFARLGLLSDASPSAKALRGELERRGLEQGGANVAVVCSAKIGLAVSELARELDRARPDVLVLDAAPEAVQAALAAGLADVRIPLVLSARGAGSLPASGRELFFVAGRSPATAAAQGEFLAEFRALHGEPGSGAAEGFELVELIATAIERAGTPRAEAVRAALADTRLDGPRGLVAAEASGTVGRPLALWRLTDRARPHLPPALAGETIQGGTSRGPDARLGPPFGAPRTLAFAFEPGTRGVRVHFGAPDVASIDADLARLGLSTGGASPFLDHLVREELLARALSIVSTKYLRAPDGRSLPGQSFRVSFATHGPQAEAPETWEAVLAGADPRANGRAFPGSGHCQVFTTNWLSTVLAHVLSPPIGPDDLELLDGTYVFGRDYKKDARSELIRALVQGYAGSLGLTTAHEVGHLFDLEHDRGDPTSLMSEDEERGLAPEEARFSEAALDRLRRNPGVVK